MPLLLYRYDGRIKKKKKMYLWMELAHIINIWISLTNMRITLLWIINGTMRNEYWNHIQILWLESQTTEEKLKITSYHRESHVDFTKDGDLLPYIVRKRLEITIFSSQHVHIMCIFMFINVEIKQQLLCYSCGIYLYSYTLSN